jgi:hypothetical protein
MMGDFQTWKFRANAFLVQQPGSLLLHNNNTSAISKRRFGPKADFAAWLKAGARRHQT